MTSHTMTHPPRQSPTRPVGPTASTALRRTVASELVKLGTLRSHVWLLVVATGFTLVLGPIQSLGQVAAGPDRNVDSAAVVSLALAGLSPATLLIGVLGGLFVAGEYGTRSVRTTFLVVPRRSYVVLAKAAALGLVAAATSVFAVAIGVTVSLSILSRADVAVGWGSPHVLRVSAAALWYVVGWAVLGQVFGWVTRSKLGGAALLIGVMVMLPPVLGLVPGRIGEVLVALAPSSAGGAMLSTTHASVLAAPAFGLALWTGYLVVLTGVAAWIVGRRDA